VSDLLATEAALTGGELMSQIKASISTLDNVAVEAIAPGDPVNPANVKRAEGIVSEADWNYLFPRRAPEYTYTNFLKAIGKFPAFCGDYSDGRDAEAICRKALATMFAHFTQETGGHTIAWPEPQWRQGLVYLRELGWSEDMANGYGLCDPGTWQGEMWPCAVFPQGHPNAGQYKSYFGRGAKQLSYNYNYGPFSEAMYGDVNVLLEQPSLVADTWLNLASAVFFYAYPQPPKPSMLHALDGTWVPNQHDLDNGLEPGFGVTTQIINGGIECGGAVEHQQSRNRIDYYLDIADYLGVPVPASEVLGCADMQRFDTEGAGALSIYWEQDWGQATACQLVNYQTPFSALQEGDYVKCVEYHFDVDIDYEN
jgi:chitodextrinase